MNIREATQADIPAIIALIAQPDMDGETLTTDFAQNIFEIISHYPNQTIFVADDGEAIVGMYMLMTIQQFSHHGAKSAVLEDVVVKTGEQGRGIGSAMMQHAAQFAAEQGCYKITLSSGEKRLQAHQFYDKFGFERHGQSFLLKLSDHSE